MEKLKAIVERITFHSEDTGWSVLRVNALERPGEILTVTIHQAKVFAGATITFFGEWVTHAKYGDQFKADRMQEEKPATASALEKYLGSGLIYGVGPKTAKKIVQYFGQDTMPVFEEKIERLMEVPGIADGKLIKIRESWNEHQEIRQVMMFLQEHGVSTLYAVKIFKQYGEKAIAIVSTNPYLLARDIYGIGFFSADTIALNIGLKEDSPQRISAGISHVLAASRDEGHCYLKGGQVIKGVIALLKQDLTDQIQIAMDRSEKEHELMVRLHETKEGKEKLYYSKSLYYDEERVAKAVLVFRKQKIPQDAKRINNWLLRYGEQQEFPLSEQQQNSVLQIAASPFSILTGGPGCGKTTTTKTLVKLLKAMGKKVKLAAPTGRAAQRMGEVIGDQAQTIHRLLVWDPSKGQFKKNEEDPIAIDFLIVDECSMLDISLTASLLKAIPSHAQILFIGDVDQLPSVGAGNVLKDLIDSQALPCFALTQVFRQAKESLIIKHAHEINQGRTPKIESPIHRPSVWEEGYDSLFIDSDEASREQAHFIQKINKSLKGVLEAQQTAVLKEDAGEYGNLYKTVSGQDELYFDEISEGELDALRNGSKKPYVFTVPEKFINTDLAALLHSQQEAQALQLVLGRVHPWSSLNFGFTATAMILRLYMHTLREKVGQYKEIQILTPMTRGTLGTKSLNALIQEHFNPVAENKPTLIIGDRKFRAGDRVIQKRNNYDLEVFNGDIGRIVAVDNQEMQLEVVYKQAGEERQVLYEKDKLIELDLAYAITIHKSQGSEFDVAIIPVFTQHFKMLYRNLVYTALTRAKKMAVLVEVNINN